MARKPRSSDFIPDESNVVFDVGHRRCPTLSRARACAGISLFPVVLLAGLLRPAALHAQSIRTYDSSVTVNENGGAYHAARCG